MTDQNPQDEINQLRSSKADQMEDAPTLGGAQKSGKEIKVRRSPWVLRSLMIVLTLLFVTELFVIGQYRKEARRIIVNNPPVVKSYPAPEISAPLPAPPVEAASADEFVEEPTPIPFPPELDGVEFPPDEE